MKEEDYLEIEAYLQGELPAEQKTALEERAKSDPAFATALAERRQLHEHLKAEAGEAALRATLNPMGTKYFPEQKEEPAVVRQLRPAAGRRRRWWVGIAAAAAIALAVIAGGQFMGEADHYEQFAQHEPLSLTERGNPASLANQAETAYNNEQYSEAINLLQEYLIVQIDDERARLALGVSLLEEDRDAEAISLFKEIVDTGSALAPYGNWYLALAAVKRGETTKANGFLDLIPASDPYLTERANRLRAAL